MARGFIYRKACMTAPLCDKQSISTCRFVTNTGSQIPAKWDYCFLQQKQWISWFYSLSCKKERRRNKRKKKKITWFSRRTSSPVRSTETFRGREDVREYESLVEPLPGLEYHTSPAAGKPHHLSLATLPPVSLPYTYKSQLLFHWTRPGSWQPSNLYKYELWRAFHQKPCSPNSSRMTNSHWFHCIDLSSCLKSLFLRSGIFLQSSA